MARRLAAIFAADVVGYSRLMAADEVGTLDRLKRLRRELVQPKIVTRGGRVVKLMGDGLLAEFPSVVDAVQCAVDIQEELMGRDAALSEERRLRLRIGVNLGDIIVEGSDIYGDGVNVAARLEALAEPGGICISGTAFDTVDGKLALAFEDLGEQRVKNIAKPVRVYRLAPRSSEGSRTCPDKPLPLPDKPSIAALPFDNMSGDPEQDYFADGITEDIITELSRLPGLFVIARNSSFSYRGKSVDVRQIARELGVRYVLEGSVRRATDRVRISAQLIDRERGSHIWAERYDRALDDIFALQEDITRNVVASIMPQIERAEMARIRSIPRTRFSSYDLALKAQSLWYDGERMGDSGLLQQAIDVANDSLKQDPRNVHALWTQAMAYFIQYLYRWGSAPKEALDHSWAAVEHLFEIDSSDPRGYAARAIVHHFRNEHGEAVADYHKAFALNPNFAMGIIMMAWCESLMGFTEQAREHAALGLRLSPRDNEIWLGCAYLALAQASFADGDFNKTKEWGKLAIQVHPKAPIRRALMIACCAFDGDLEEAGKHIDYLKSFAPEFIPSVLRGDITLYSDPAHNALLAEGLRKAGVLE